MAFDVRCPACKAKMRFDDPPKRGEEIECPKCNQTFAVPSASAFEEKKPEAAKKADEPKQAKANKVVEAVPRTYFNHWLLLLIVGGLMFVLTTTLTVVWVIVARAAKAEDMLATVPDNYNVIRGVNVKALRNYPGVKQNGEKFYTADAKAAYDVAAKKLGLDENDLGYFIVARDAGSDSVLYLFATVPEFKPADLGDGQAVGLGWASHPEAMVVCPTRWLIAVSYGGNPSGVLSTVAQNARSRPRDGMHIKVGTTGRLALRGQVWAIFRDAGSLKGWIGNGSEALKEDGTLAKLKESMGKASVLATWVSFGSSGVKFGAGMELPTSSDADALVADMKKGPLGKADDSEPPRGFKTALTSVGDIKQNGAFYQYLEYKKQGTCAYCTSKVEDPDKASSVLNEFLNPSRGAGGGGGQGSRGG
jgi:hypothetical protein